MPQMAPIWWSTLFTMFMLTLLIIIMMNYFNITYKIMVKSNKLNNKIIKPWKW